VVPMVASMPERTIVLNATTINKGGGIQAVVSFICQVINQFQCNGDARWIFAVSGEVRDQLADFGHALRNGVDLCLEHSPAKNRRSRRNLYDFVSKRVDLVFTFFGPAYVAFRCPHICGVADGWVTHSSKLAYSTLPTFKEKRRRALLSVYKSFWLHRADYWVVEHEAARAGLINRLRLPARNIYVVSNNCSQAYLDEKAAEQPRALQSRIRILTFAAYFPNKCLELIPLIAAQLVRQHHIGNVQFVLTVPEEEYAQSAIAKLAGTLGVERYISNVGYVALKDGPALYRSCDIVLLPSVLETFSATYPESMRMGVPIVTSDLEFARTICGDAALYFKPLDAAGAAERLAMLIQENDMRAKVVAAGFNRARDFPSPMEKYRQYKSIIDEILIKMPPDKD
jgi:glycosyltransferase involved in cell wall biosynthesis